MTQLSYDKNIHANTEKQSHDKELSICLDEASPDFNDHKEEHNNHISRLSTVGIREGTKNHSTKGTLRVLLVSFVT
jgi:hypothetical protein